MPPGGSGARSSSRPRPFSFFSIDHVKSAALRTFIADTERTLPKEKEPLSFANDATRKKGRGAGGGAGAGAGADSEDDE